jgi:polyhydroxyalkanoate synthesis regulator phasin
MKKLVGIIFICFLSLNSCLTGNDSFLISNLNDDEKSDLLTQKGIERYKKEIEQNEEYKKSEEIKKYFTTALSYNNANKTAAEYIKKIDFVKQRLVNKYYKTAIYYKNKKNRTIDDEYNMCYYLEKSIEIEPSNKDALKLKRENKDVYDKLIKFYLNKGNDIKNKIKDSKNDSYTERLYINGINNYKRILLIDASNNQALNEYKSFESEISKIVSSQIKALGNKIKAGNYDEVYESLNKLDKNNQIINNKYNDEILDLKYQLYYNWSIFLYKKNKLQLSLYKINAALSIKKDNYLLSLKDKISETLQSEFFKNSFESLSDEIDELIDNGSLDVAKNKIDGLKKSVKDQNQKKELDNKINRIIQKLPTIYDEAVNAYNDENFDIAIKKFQIIITVDPNYKEAKNYLDKAVEKQKVLENY